MGPSIFASVFWSMGLVLMSEMLSTDNQKSHSGQIGATGKYFILGSGRSVQMVERGR